MTKKYRGIFTYVVGTLKVVEFEGPDERDLAEDLAADICASHAPEPPEGFKWLSTGHTVQELVGSGQEQTWI